MIHLWSWELKRTPIHSYTLSPGAFAPGLRSFDDHVPLKLREGEKYSHKQFAHWRVINQPHVQNVYDYPSLSEVLNDFAPINSSTSKAIKLCDDQLVTRLKLLDELRKIRSVHFRPCVLVCDDVFLWRSGIPERLFLFLEAIPPRGLLCG